MHVERSRVFRKPRDTVALTELEDERIFALKRRASQTLRCYRYIGSKVYACIRLRECGRSDCHVTRSPYASDENCHQGFKLDQL